MSKKVVNSFTEELLCLLDKKTLNQDLDYKEMQIVEKQLNKARLILTHLIFQEKVSALRKNLSIPKEGFLNEDTAFEFLSSANQDKLSSKLKDLMEQFNVSDRWFTVFKYNLLFNTTDIPARFIPSPIEMYIPSERDRLVIQIFKDTTYTDFKEVWDTIKQQQAGLKPNIPTESKVNSQAMVWNEESNLFELVDTAPARNTNKLEDLYKKGELIVAERAKGTSDKDIAALMQKDRALTAEDVADTIYRYKKILDQLYLH